ncbi:methyl-accepting chemotaxis protein [Pleionea sp. CnH1-48]|uniref:methyl-accepting chemotaxis protein n=1 Tax=Pleionea sp. CnH1-48 TaxID=2954494 RepID=UPI002096BB21|nr:methyl-accepting chemotaxis protein [Pleionea sp. CnH1-48]MCO7226026.1 methyl-accepting chemotaxis protein [Pleionea sp. CnH1-48]
MIAVPMFVMLPQVWVLHSEKLSQLALEEQGFALVEQIQRLPFKLAAHRDSVSRQLNGDNSLSANISNLSSEIQSLFNQLKSFGETDWGTNYGSELNRLQAEWDALSSMQTQDAMKRFDGHSELISQHFFLMEKVAQDSGLVLDSQLDTHYLSLMATNLLPHVYEDVSRLSTVAVNVTQKGQFTPESFLRMRSFYESILARKRNMNAVMQFVFSKDENTRKELQQSASSVNQALDGFLNTIRKDMMDSDSLNVSTAQVLSQGQGLLTELAQLEAAVAQGFSRNLAKTQSQLSTSRAVNMMVSLVVFVMVLAFAFLTLKNLTESVSYIRTKAGLIAKGDLTEALQLEGSDELCDIADDIELMRAGIRGLVEEIQTANSLVASTTEQLTLSARATTGNAQEQLNSSEQVATASEELSATIAEVSNSSSNASEQSQNLMVVSQSSLQSLSSTMGSIEELSSVIGQASTDIQQLAKEVENIGKVTEVIKSIAEQTNLLALNAAIEAARAGESGRGFAVVADEVRSLASRTQISTEEIAKTIDLLQSGTSAAVAGMNRGTEQSNIVVSNTREVSESIRQIGSGMEELRAINLQIANASEQQAEVTANVTQNTVQLRDISAGISNEMEGVSQSCEGLKGQTERLAETIGAFRVE